ncbi:CueP family metal-binding protein [Rhodococcus sp. IEGM 1408]|uniref:CueP family metal-binding protein n=1 Tax=Rhodococcus sp. IEGM 1408 TaxID=3082220 RepID=UPI00295492CD|nr:CueP family metal-binding protein [Rhodococcus sp. IEGM 1408]MDV8001417.1 CueP family metal-binding protein [Rhodococcus sp. IEGM 1408]
MSASRTLPRPGARPGMLLAAAAVALAGCAAPQPTPEPTPQPAPEPAASVLEQHQLTGLDARQVIDRLDATPVVERPDDLLASVQPDQLVLTDPTEAGAGAGAGAETLPMPDDEFYLSVAPYRAFTHDCFFHSLTTCLGELGREPVQVTVTDDATGRTVLDERRTTFDNGFVGLWLPRDLTGTLTIEHDGRAASSPISTGGDDLTCLTTMELA